MLWDLPNGKQSTRIYEGTTPQQVWQAAMLEGIGIRRTDLPMCPYSAFVHSEETIDPATFEAADEEEQKLRTELAQMRKQYLVCCPYPYTYPYTHPYTHFEYKTHILPYSFSCLIHHNLTLMASHQIVCCYDITDDASCGPAAGISTSPPASAAT